MELEAIKEYWDYQKSDRPEGHIGMSLIGHCGRQLGYVHHKVPGLQLDWRAKIIFDDGNLHHTQIRKALREGLVLKDSCYSLVKEEETVALGSLKGHIDGILQHDHIKCKGGDHQTMLLEVKSMNDRGFQELKRTGVLQKEYGSQTSAYLRATGLRTACILAKNKNSGEMLRLYYTIDDVLLDERIGVLFSVGASDDPEAVPREYGPDARGRLPWQCNYCPFVNLCWRHEGVKNVGPHKYELVTKTVSDDKNVDGNVKETSKSNRKRRKGLA